MLIHLLVFLLALGAALWLYGRRQPGLLGLRGLSLLLLLLMLLDPTFTWHRQRALQPVVVVDASQSMAQDGKWAQVQHLLQRLAPYALPVQYLVDSQQVASVDSPQGNFTDLSVPLRHLQAPVILLSDGLHNAGPSPLDLPYAYPVSVWWPRVPFRGSPLERLEFRMPHRWLEHTPFTLTLFWPRPPAGTLAVFLNDSLVATYGLAAGTSWQASLSLPGLPPGSHSVKAIWLPQRTSRHVKIQVEPVPFRALIRVYRPLPVVRALRRTLETYGQVEVWFHGPSGWRRLGASPSAQSTPPNPKEYPLVVDVAPSQAPADSFGHVVIAGPEAPEGWHTLPGPWLWPSHPNLPPLEYLRLPPPGLVGQGDLILQGPKGQRTPWVVWDTTGPLRLWLLSGQGWRWALAQPAVWDSLWDAWLSRLLAHRVLFRASVSPPVAAPRAPLTVEALLTDFRGRRLPKAWVQVVRGPQLLELEPGRYQARLLAADSVGDHRLQVMYGVGDDTLGMATLRYRTQPLPLERLTQGTDSLLLLYLARRTGGAVWPDTGLPPVHPYIQRETLHLRFARSPWLFLALLCTLLLEWFLRQRKGWL